MMMINLLTGKQGSSAMTDDDILRPPAGGCCPVAVTWSAGTNMLRAVSLAKHSPT